MAKPSIKVVYGSKRSGGPQSAAGIDRASKNSSKHLLTKDGPSNPEERRVWDQLFATWSAHFAPMTPPKLALVEDVVDARIKMKRCRRVDEARWLRAQELAASLNLRSAVGDLPLMAPAPSELDVLGAMPDLDRIDTLHRYHAAAERSFRNALNALEELRRYEREYGVDISHFGNADEPGDGPG